ncbi:unnamed protein product [Lupinus luteus]|uniref:Gnk2-homologous domain-containing protein n=1 Tax=Lupinus luteus TaxID=3873 RepID=A0AAV1VWT3_LUPLU
MALSLSFLTTILIILSSLPSPTLSSSSSTDSFVYIGCTQQRYTPNSAYETNINSLLTSLTNSATYSSYNHFSIVGGSSSHDVVYGLYQCRGDLAMPDCATCIAKAVTRAGNVCPQACGGAVQLEGCYIKYDNVTFLGQEDKTVVLKKCGTSMGDNTGQRDMVLAALAGSGGAFRVGGSGQVKGMAQCSGDLSFAQCQDCVGEAIKRLKSECGAADYGDMFLAKCYARYSANGAHAYSNKSHGKSGNGGEKKFAIIIGLLAGVAILIIFLLFLRRICEGQGK